MRISHAEVTLTKIPTKRPHKMSYATSRFQECVYLQLFTDEGITGWGEAPHMAGFSGKGETQASVALQLRERLLPAIMGKDPTQVEARMLDLEHSLPWNPRAKSAVCIALFDVVAKALETPVYNLLGGKFRSRVPLSWSIPITDHKAAVEEAESMIERGFQILKLKTGHEDPRHDVERFRQVRNAVGPTVQMRADANQAWDVKTAISVIRELETLDIQFMEQPTKAWDLQGMAEIGRSTNAHIMADEAANSPRDVLNLAQSRAADLISIYINNSKGFLGAKKMATIADAAGMGCYVGGALEGPVAARACLHFAASTPAVSWGCEMVGQFLLEEDLGAELISFEDGALEVPDDPGLGVDLDMGKLDRFEIDSFEVASD